MQTRIDVDTISLWKYEQRISRKSEQNLYEMNRLILIPNVIRYVHTERSINLPCMVAKKNGKIAAVGLI